MIYPETDQTYTCANCGGTFIHQGYICLVAHRPGSCCHYGDNDALSGKNARLHDPLGKGGVRQKAEKWFEDRSTEK